MEEESIIILRRLKDYTEITFELSDKGLIEIFGYVPVGLEGRQTIKLSYDSYPKKENIESIWHDAIFRSGIKELLRKKANNIYEPYFAFEGNQHRIRINFIEDTYYFNNVREDFATRGPELEIPIQEIQDFLKRHCITNLNEVDPQTVSIELSYKLRKAENMDYADSKSPFYSMRNKFGIRIRHFLSNLTPFVYIDFNSIGLNLHLSEAKRLMNKAKINGYENLEPEDLDVLKTIIRLEDRESWESQLEEIPF